MDIGSVFHSKKITLMGLGVLGRGVGDAQFLAQEGARVLVTDLKKAADLESSLRKIRPYKNIKYRLGRHAIEDFVKTDMVIKAAGVPHDSVYIEAAQEHKIPVEMDASLFAKLAKGVKTIGITGTKGKSTTTHLIYEILRENYKESQTSVFLGGNVQGMATLPLIKKVKKGDLAVLELDSWQLQGFGDAKISPNVAVFTTFMDDHLNYYKGDKEKYLLDKAQIFLHQRASDVLVMGEEVSKLVLSRFGLRIKSKIYTPVLADLPKRLKLKLLGRHNLDNVGLAVKICQVLGVNDSLIREVVENFSPVEGRLQLVKEVNGVKIYNDTTATTPDATLAGLKALSKNKNAVLIIGGADKALDISGLISAIPNYCKAVIVLPGTGTDKIKSELIACQAQFVQSLSKAIRAALSKAQRGDLVLFSPAFASFGLFINEFERGEKFNKLVAKL